MDSQIELKRETEFYQGFIRLKMSVSNKAPSVITDVTLDFIYEDDILRIDRHEPLYEIKNGKVLLGNISGGTSKSIAVYFDPLMCSRGTEINCFVIYRDENRRLDSVFMDPKIISVVCPILNTDSDINIGRLKEFIELLPSRDSKVYEIHEGFDIFQLVNIAREVVEKYDVRHIRTLHTKDGRECEIWYYGKTKVQRENIVIKLSLVYETQSLELFAATEKAEALTGLLAEVGRNLKSSLESRTAGRGNVINLTIKDSIIQRSSLLDHCDMNGSCSSDIVFEDGIVKGYSFPSGREEIKPFQAESETIEPFIDPHDGLGRIRRGADDLQSQKAEVDLMIQEEDRHLKQKEEEEKLKKEIERLIKLKEEEEKLLKQKESTVSNVPKDLTENGIEFVLIPAGEFMMGSMEGSAEQPVHKVTIRKPFYLGKYPITQKQWESVMGSNPSHFKYDDLPVEHVSWNDVQEFVRKLNQMEETDKYRLPSEAEWEYTCRAGTTTSNFFGDDESKLRYYAWYGDNSGSKTHSVGQKNSNPWGLYDMHGNVCEWCQDIWHDNYSIAPSDGSAWEDGSSSNRVIRGGSWNFHSMYCRSAYRYRYAPSDHYDYLGFRILRDI